MPKSYSHICMAVQLVIGIKKIFFSHKTDIFYIIFFFAGTNPLNVWDAHCNNLYPSARFIKCAWVFSKIFRKTEILFGLKSNWHWFQNAFSSIWLRNLLCHSEEHTVWLRIPRESLDRLFSNFIEFPSGRLYECITCVLRDVILISTEVYITVNASV